MHLVCCLVLFVADFVLFQRLAVVVVFIGTHRLIFEGVSGA